MIILLGIMLFISINFTSALDILNRDPFCLPYCTTKNVANQSIVLQGIVRQGNRYGALLAHGKESSVVFIDDTCQGYVVTDVTQNEVYLKLGAKQIILKLEQEI